MDKEARREQMLATINDTIVTAGFADLKMDQIAKLMGVSRGKLYQYYSSKDAVIQAVTQRYFNFMQRLVLPNSKTRAEFLKAYPAVFIQILTLVGSSSQIFRNDLNQFYPELAEQFAAEYQTWSAKINQFLLAGQQVGAFNANWQPAVFLLQLEGALPSLIDPHQLTSHQLLPKQTFVDFYQFNLMAVIRPEFWEQVRAIDIQSDLQHLLTKYQRAFN